MSLRHMKKVYGTNDLQPPEGESDEEYEPACTKTAVKSLYEGLLLSDHSEEDSEEGGESEECSAESVDVQNRKKKNKKKNNKNDKIDEVERSVKEVNALLGSPKACSSKEPEATVLDPAQQIIAVQNRNLIAATELKRLFGPEEPDTEKRQRRRQPKIQRLKKILVVPASDEFENFQRIGLSMSVNRKENGVTFFTYDHSKEYQRMHRRFLETFDLRKNFDIDTPTTDMHVEELIEDADVAFRKEEYSKANKLIELAIGYMQFCAHPSFNLTNGKTRLEYKFIENRPFHIAVLKYLHLLTNRACHRTALELAKLLLNLDPCDPLAILLVIDVLAIRAREHQWLIDAVDIWAAKRDAGFLFNIQYSYAMCHLQVAVKNKQDVKYADELLQMAIMRFPTVVTKILGCAFQKVSDKIKKCALYADETTPKNLQDLIILYANFVWSRWRERPVLEWLVRNAEELADKYENDVEVKEKVTKLMNERLNLFQAWPVEVVRHLCVIKPMGMLLVDGTVPQVTTRESTNPPPPPTGVDRYGYVIPRAQQLRMNASPPRRVFYEFFTSVMPYFNVANLPQEAIDALPADFDELVEFLSNLRVAEYLDEDAEEVALLPAHLNYDDDDEEDDVY